MTTSLVGPSDEALALPRQVEDEGAVDHWVEGCVGELGVVQLASGRL
ncbi:hypothetical protein ACU635_07160 [[Actinomadura] parvosata]